MIHLCHSSINTHFKSLIAIVSIALLLCLQACTPQPSPAKESHITDVPDLYDYDVEQKIADLGITLNKPKLPVKANIEAYTKTGNLLFLSGKGPTLPEGTKITGKVGAELSKEEGQEAARQIAINQLEVIKAAVGDLNNVVRVVKVLGMVNATPEFTEQPYVINGFSNLMIEVFGDRGRHARSAVGMASLPGNIACEIEVVLEVRE